MPVGVGFVCGVSEQASGRGPHGSLQWAVSSPCRPPARDLAHYVIGWVVPDQQKVSAGFICLKALHRLTGAVPWALASINAAARSLTVARGS